MSYRTSNNCQFIGRLGRDPIVNATENGTIIANFSLAVDKYHKGPDGKWVNDDPLWINVSCFDRLAEKAMDFLTKGRKILVVGRIDLRKYTDKQGMPGSSLNLTAEDLEVFDKAKDAEVVEGPEFGPEVVNNAAS